MPPLNLFSRNCLALAIGQAMVMPAQAATITVNTTGDVDGGGPCTLREAITSIQDPPSIAATGCNYVGLFGVNDTVDFDPGLSGQTITLSQAAPLSVSNTNLTINGLGENLLIINGDNNAGVFNSNSSTLTLNDLTISGGSTSGGGSTSAGGGIFAENESDISLIDITVSGNYAEFRGGGIYARGLSTVVSLTNSTVSGNHSGNDGGGIGINLYRFIMIDSTVSGNSTADHGGGIYTRGGSNFVSLTNSTVSGNTATDGGGISARYNTGTVSLNNSMVSGNTAVAEGGGIRASDFSNFTLDNSTVSGNSASNGGGIFSFDSSTSFSLSNSTVSGNYAGTAGGGIRVEFGSVALENTTVSNNSATSNGGVSAANSSSVSLVNSTVAGNSASFFNGGIAANSGSSVSLSNSIVAGNRALFYAEILNNASTITANNGNLFGDAFHINDAAAFGNFSPGVMDINANSTDGLGIPLASILEPLGNNGGPTQTHALLEGSPAINAGANPSCPPTDQRGRQRSDNLCDIGAYEFIGGGFFVVPLPGERAVIFEL